MPPRRRGSGGANSRKLPRDGTRFLSMTHGPDGDVNITPDEEITEEMLDEVSGGAVVGIHIVE